ncbi:MAG TPA: hypothetical protein VN364_11415 [Bellilinea sp.]|nr:hypothetical protein [Bellilinea sp.]
MGLFSRQKNAAAESKKYDGLIESVRRSADGQVEVARFFERRGPTWSDHMLIQRDDLVKRVKKGEKFVIGERLTYMGGTFEVFSKVHLTSNSGKEKLVTSISPDTAIELQEAPLF